MFYSNTNEEGMPLLAINGCQEKDNSLFLSCPQEMEKKLRHTELSYLKTESNEKLARE